MSLADLTPTQINRVLTHSAFLKKRSIPWVYSHLYSKKKTDAVLPPQSLFLKTIALLFSKRSTRTRLAAETSAELLGGKALFLGKEDIQLGVNESVRDSAIIMSGMCQGIFARVGEHSEIEVCCIAITLLCHMNDHVLRSTIPILPCALIGTRKIL